MRSFLKHSLSIAIYYFSLALLVAMLALRIRCHWFWDHVDVQKHSMAMRLMSGNGCVNVEIEIHAEGTEHFQHFSLPTSIMDDYTDIERGFRETAIAFEDHHWAFWHGFGIKSGSYFSLAESPPFWYSGPIYAIQFPDWSLILALSIAPTLRLRSFLKHRHRRTAGLCPQCGYDLRATPSNCPECGRSV